MHLIVVHPFGAYKRGDAITDADEVERVNTPENEDKFVRVSAPRQPAKE